MFTATLSAPIGPIVIAGDTDRLTSIRIIGSATPSISNESTRFENALLNETCEQLTAWFDRRLKRFDLPLAPTNTPRGADLRAAICSIGYGETASYGELARHSASGPRAIGQACRRNPFPIIVPCHRVIGAAQSIGYYSGGDGIATKRWLIDFELNLLV